MCSLVVVECGLRLRRVSNGYVRRNEKLNWTELNWTELNWNWNWNWNWTELELELELNWTELNWTELNWNWTGTELNWTELNWTELSLRLGILLLSICTLWFQTFAVFCMLYMFFWVISRRLNSDARELPTRTHTAFVHFLYLHV